MSKQRKKSRTRGRRPNTNTADIAGKDVEVQGREMSSRNDPSWYKASPQLVEDVGRLSFNNPAGLRTDFMRNWDDSKGIYPAFHKFSSPGMMTLTVTPGIGLSTDNASAINTATRNIYSYVRHANSGHANYDAPDLMMYMLAMDSAFMWYSVLVRLYGTLMLYNYRNRYYPKALVQAMGFDFDDLSQHIADLRYTINMYVNRIGTLFVPGHINLYQRHMWLFSNYFQDEDSAKAQMYMMVPRGLYYYDEYDGAGALRFTEWDMLYDEEHTTGDYLNYLHIVQICNKFTSKLMSSEDVGIISGDLLKAYGAEKAFTLSTIDADWAITPSMSAEVISQFHNAIAMGDLDDADITQDTHIDPDTHEVTGTGAILYNPTFQVYGSDDVAMQRMWQIYSTGHILDMYQDDPTPDDVMVATRLTTGTDLINPTTVYFGTEIVNYMTIFKFTADENDNWGRITKMSFPYVQFQSTLSIPANAQYLFDMISQLSAFHNHPPVVHVQHFGTGDSTYLTGNLNFELDNYTYLDGATLKKLHETAILSLFSVPEVQLFKG